MVTWGQIIAAYMPALILMVTILLSLMSSNKRIESLENSLNKRIDSVENGLNRRIDDLNRRFDHLDSRFDRLEEKLEGKIVVPGR
jgi:hypothetical protein